MHTNYLGSVRFLSLIHNNLKLKLLTSDADTKYSFHRNMTAALPIKDQYLEFINILIQNRNFHPILPIMKDSVNELSSADMNYLSAETFRLLGDIAGNCNICYGILAILDALEDGPDTVSYTAAMSLFIRNKKYEDALSLFSKMKEISLPMDTVAYICAIRATGFIRTWKDTMSILNEAYDTLGFEALHVAHTAMINLNYETAGSSLQTMC